MKLKKLYLTCLSFTALLFFTGIFSQASAHEIYVLSNQKFAQGLHAPTIDTWKDLSNPANAQFTAIIVVITLVVLAAFFYLRYTQLGLTINKQLKKLVHCGLFVIRIALAASFFYAGATNSIFGPELALHTLPLHTFLPFVEYSIGFLFLFGLFTEFAALLALILYFLAVLNHGMYMLTYLNYLGEIIALILFGSRFLSFDRLLFGRLQRFSKLKAYESTIIRVCYGAALLYAAIYIKIIHSQIPLDVVTQYHLNHITWLFPSDPFLIVLGAAIVEVVIAVFIIVGFSTRLTNIVLMFYLTLSILFFKEAVWPHYMLYGISLSLLFTGGGALSVDEALTPLFSKEKIKRKK